MEINRLAKELLLEYLDIFPAVGIVGPRQVGKTTLAKSLQERDEIHYLDLESAADRRKLADPVLYLANYTDKIIVLDEIQQMPELFAELRGIIDADRRPGRLILLGSASPEMMRRSADSLAGRIGYIELTPFLQQEIATESHQALWIKGGFPLSYLSTTDRASLIWRKNFIRTYVEKDLAMLGLSAEARTIERFWRMLSAVHGNLWNAESIGRSMGLSAPTINRYLDFMEGAFLIRRLLPYSVNIRKRLVKSPKIYLRDSGILHAFKEISNFEQLYVDPQVGASWEGYVIEQIIAATAAAMQPYFYRTQQGAECDLLLERNNEIVAAIEVKFSSSPKIGKGFRISMEDTRAKHGYVIAPVNETYPVAENITVLALSTFLSEYIQRL